MGKIAEALEVEYDVKERKTDLTLKIEGVLKENPELEPTVRAIATVILDDYEQMKAEKKKNRTRKESGTGSHPPSFALRQ